MGTPDRLDDFQIVDEIGRGGFGIVYRARQISLDRPVAVKVLFRHLIHTEDQVSRFEREARAAARLDHPSIVSVFAWGEAGEDFYIAQRLVGSGRTLADDLTEMRKTGVAPKGWFRQIAGLLVKVSDALQQAHDRGIVHRDVKPSNILLDEQGRPYLGDFGLAKIEDGLELSRTGDFAGSPYYMSPEQADARRGAIDHRTDIYSLGVTLYELLTLTQPFQGTTSQEVIRRILSEEPRRPARIEPRVPADLETICLHAMEKGSAQRYQTAEDMRQDLQAFLDGEPILAVPISTSRRVWRAMRRHHQPVTMILLAVMLVFGGLWAGGALRASQTAVKQSETTAAVQAAHAEELGRSTAEFGRKMQHAAERQDSEGVSRLIEEQERTAQQIDETSAWLAQQVSALGDAESLTKVGGGLATGGLIGGLQSFTQALAGQKAQENSKVLIAEATRRMEELYNTFGTAAEEATGTLSFDFSRNTILFLAGHAYAVPLELPEGEAASEGGGAPQDAAPAPAAGGANPGSEASGG
ncbi:MAG: serine/threonine-protein kinase [Planctomycetota bacterium]|jgi:hypothetical protein